MSLTNFQNGVSSFGIPIMGAGVPSTLDKYGSLITETDLTIITENLQTELSRPYQKPTTKLLQIEMTLLQSMVILQL